MWQGLGWLICVFSPVNPFSKAMEYKPTDMQRRAKHERYVQETLAPHLLILRYIRQHLQPCGAVDYHTTLSLYRLVMTSLTASKETRYVFIPAFC